MPGLSTTEGFPLLSEESQVLAIVGYGYNRAPHIKPLPEFGTRDGQRQWRRINALCRQPSLRGSIGQHKVISASGNPVTGHNVSKRRSADWQHRTEWTLSATLTASVNCPARSTFLKGRRKAYEGPATPPSLSAGPCQARP